MKITRNKILHSRVRLRSTLLIPEYLFCFYEELRDRHGGLSILLGFLIAKFYRNKGQIHLERDIAATMDYQEEGLCLHREDFRSYENDWIKLKLLASSHNLSVCKFFVLLLQLEMAGALEEEVDESGVPPQTPRSSLYQTITLTSIPQFTRLLHLRI